MNNNTGRELCIKKLTGVAKKNNGSRCRSRGAAVRTKRKRRLLRHLLDLRRCDRVLDGLREIELRSRLRRDLDGLSRCRVASHARLALNFLQASESRKNKDAVLLGLCHCQVGYRLQECLGGLIAYAVRSGQALYH